MIIIILILFGATTENKNKTRSHFIIVQTENS